MAMFRDCLEVFYSALSDSIRPTGPQLCQKCYKSVLSRKILILWAILDLEQSIGFVFLKALGCVIVLGSVVCCAETQQGTDVQ